jgi:hypothetical protein
LSTISLSIAHDRFERWLPTLLSTARFAFRRLGEQDREEALAATVAAAWSAWRGLLRRGKDPEAVGLAGIAHYAVRYVKGGRNVGNVGSGRSRLDLGSRRAQMITGRQVINLDEAGWLSCSRKNGRWTPADAAGFKIDFECWLGTLTERRRKTAMLLAAGHGTGEVARAIGITAPAVSQARASLESNWNAFRREAES